MRNTARLLAGMIASSCVLGVLWAATSDQNVVAQGKGKLPPTLAPENLARGKKATASSSQDESKSPAQGVDGSPDTRWCAADGSVPQWFQVDLGQPEDLTGCQIVWEFEGPGYACQVDGSPDGKQWSKLVEATSGKAKEQTQRHTITASGVRHVKLTITSSAPGKWASFFEFAAFGKKLVPADAAQAPAATSPLLADVKAPPGYQVTLFAAPPQVNYPACIAALPTGELFVGVDANGSLDAKAGRGKIVRLVDTDNDGKADLVTEFTKIDSPRGLIATGKTVYLLHPPFLSAYHDDDGDGKADRSEILVKGIGFDLKFRGADHTTNGIRMGIDGWIYVAVGDYGFTKAEGKDGAKLQLHGGGIVRVRPDGTNLELVVQGLRNIYDVAIDPRMNLFTRDNTNDGDGWNVRLSHIVPYGVYGYPTLYVNFANEIIPPMIDSGGGSPTGVLYLSEPGFPKEVGDSLLTCEWGRNAIQRHPLKKRGATFDAEVAPFLQITRPTDLDVDGLGRLYVASWRGASFTYAGENVGYIARVTHPGTKVSPLPDLAKLSDESLVLFLRDELSQVRRLAAQREILRRGEKFNAITLLEKVAFQPDDELRMAALFTYKQLLGAKATPFLKGILHSGGSLGETALQTLVDRKDQLGDVSVRDLAQFLTHKSPRMRLLAIIGLIRKGDAEAGPALLKATTDTDAMVAHLAIQALVQLRAADACLATLENGDESLHAGSLRALQMLHDPKVVAGLGARFDTTKTTALRQGILTALCRLQNREAEWDGKWWGTRPDTAGPYFKAVAWSESPRIAEALKKSLANGGLDEVRYLLKELQRHRLDFPEATARVVKLAEQPEGRAFAVELWAGRKVLPTEAIPMLTNAASSTKDDAALRTKALRALIRSSGQEAALAGAFQGLAVGANTPELTALHAEFVRDAGHAKRVAFFRKAAQADDASQRRLAFNVLLNLSASKLATPEVRDEVQRAVEQAMARPDASLSLLQAIGDAMADDFGFQVKTLLKSTSPDVQKEAARIAKLLDLDRPLENRKDVVKTMKHDDVVALALKEKGDPAVGARLYVKQGCIACHTVAKNEPPKGPYLGDIANRYKRPELLESILKPSAKIAQGFETNQFVLTNGKIVSGFVVRESGDEVEIRDASGIGATLKKNAIDERSRTHLSAMPEQLVEALTVRELASILAYLEALNRKASP